RYAVSNSSMNLSFHDSGIDLPSAVVNDNIAQHFDLECFGIYFHHRHMSGAGKTQLYPNSLFFIRMLGQGIAVVMKRFEARLAVRLLVRQAPVSSARDLSDG